MDGSVTVQSIQIDPFSTLNAGSHTITLSGATPTIFDGTFNAGTSTVKFSDADHTFDTDVTFYNLQWATPLTAPRTITVNAGKTVTKAAGGTFNLDGSSATNTVSFAGTGTISPAMTVYYCATPGGVTGFTCEAGGPPGPGYSSNPAPGTITLNNPTPATPNQIIEISETGDADLVISSATITGTDAAKFDVSPTTLNIADGGAPKTVVINCFGSSVGTFTAQLEIVHNATGSPATYPISCVIGGGGGSGTPVQASVESDLAFVLTFLGIVLFTAFKMRKNKA